MSGTYWTCSQCTFDNEPGDLRCQICQFNPSTARDEELARKLQREEEERERRQQQQPPPPPPSSRPPPSAAPAATTVREIGQRMSRENVPQTSRAMQKPSSSPPLMNRLPTPPSSSVSSLSAPLSLSRSHTPPQVAPISSVRQSEVSTRPRRVAPAKVHSGKRRKSQGDDQEEEDEANIDEEDDPDQPGDYDDDYEANVAYDDDDDDFQPHRSSSRVKQPRLMSSASSSSLPPQTKRSATLRSDRTNVATSAGTTLTRSSTSVNAPSARQQRSSSAAESRATTAAAAASSAMPAAGSNGEMRHHFTRQASLARQEAPQPVRPSDVDDDDWVFKDEDDLPADHSPLQLLQLETEYARSPFRAADIGIMLQRGYTAPSTPSATSSSTTAGATSSQTDFQSHIRTDTDLRLYVDLLWRLMESHHDGSWLIPAESLRAIWLGILSPDVTLQCADQSIGILSHLTRRSIFSFLPTVDTWNEWQHECIRFQHWLQKKQNLRKSGELEKMREQAEKMIHISSTSSDLPPALSTLPPIPSPSASSSASTFSTEFTREFEAAHRQLSDQERISSVLKRQLEEEQYFAKWSLKITLLLRVFAADQHVRLHGFQAFRQSPSTSNALTRDEELRSTNNERRELSALSTPLLQRLIQRGRHVLGFEHIEVDANQLERERGPDIIRDEIQLQPVGKTKSSTRARRRLTKKQRAEADSLKAAERLSLGMDAPMQDIEEDEEDPMDVDDQFLGWWMALLPLLELTLDNRSSLPSSNTLTPSSISTSAFRSPRCLQVCQENVVDFIRVLQAYYRHKAGSG